MYSLARELGCSRAASLVAGVVLLSAPVHLVGLRGHLAKVFLGLMPLALLVLRRALDARRSPAWCGAFGGVSLLLILHSPFQFVQVALIAPLVALAALLGEIDRRAVARRSIWAALAALALAGPQLAAIVNAAADPAVVVDRQSETASHQPDAVQLVLPPSFSQMFGDWTSATLAARGIQPEIETEVAVPLIVAILCLAAVIKDRQRSLLWVDDCNGWRRAVAGADAASRRQRDGSAAPLRVDRGAAGTRLSPHTLTVPADRVRRPCRGRRAWHERAGHHAPARMDARGDRDWGFTARDVAEAMADADAPARARPLRRARSRRRAVRRARSADSSVARSLAVRLLGTVSGASDDAREGHCRRLRLASLRASSHCPVYLRDPARAGRHPRERLTVSL